MNGTPHMGSKRRQIIVPSYILALVVSSNLFSYPVAANASIRSFLGEIFSGKSANTALSTQNNSQNMAILQDIGSPNPDFARGGGDITVVGDSALLSDAGPIGTQADISDRPINSGQISIYVVHQGDSLGQIAKMFDVSVNTIIWANSLSGSAITPGQKLVILPVSGIYYTVNKGDTINNIAKKYKADVDEVMAFNGLSEDTLLNPGDMIIIPDGEQVIPTQSNVSSGSKIARGAQNTPDYAGYYVRPIGYGEGRKTQGLHGYNGIDIGASVGTPVIAAAAGEVIVARASGWNGGYGEYLVIKHGNGTQTLYSHMSSLVVQEGARVFQGQIIGYVGSTGRSTGPHLHFEIRGAKNPF